MAERFLNTSKLGFHIILMEVPLHFSFNSDPDFG